ncbi:MAG: efflux RND transporter periplasmic adaptor subunit [Mucilaginibacter sp.]
MTRLRIFLIAALFIFSGCSNNNIIHPQKKDIIETVYASGKIMADSEYTVYALNPGTVVQKLVNDGDHVKKGQVLYVINNTAPAAKLSAANISYENAQENLSPNSRVLNDLKISMRNADIKFSNDSLQYMRLKNLWQQNIGTKSALDNAEVQYRTSLNDKQSAKEKYYSAVNDLKVSLKNAESQLASAQNDLNNYIIRADAPGTIYQTMKEKGEAVKANEALALLGQSAERLIRLSVDQQDIDRVEVGQQVLLKTDATGDKIFKASVVRIYPTMNEADQTFRVDAVFTDNENQSYIHTSVEANIIIQRKQQALVIPSNVLLTGDSVKVKEDGHIKTIAVKTGIHTLDEAEILSGLNEQSDVVVPSVK